MGKSDYAIHEDFKGISFAIPMNPILLLLGQPLSKMMYLSHSVDDRVACRPFKVPVRGGDRIRARTYFPKGASGTLPCVFFIHGGGFALHAVHYHREIACRYVVEARCAVVDLEYRLLPLFPFPRAFEDCYGVFKWLYAGGASLDIDRERIGLCGDSAGGALAAGLAQALRDRDGIRPLFQMLVCPVLDASSSSASMDAYDDTPVWNSKSNRKMWKMYLGRRGDAAGKTYASPMANADLRNLPPAYIEVSEFDCLRDEGVRYANLLEKAGVPVVLDETAGTIHGFELAAKSAYRNEIISRRVGYVAAMFKRGP